MLFEFACMLEGLSLDDLLDPELVFSVAACSIGGI